MICESNIALTKRSFAERKTTLKNFIEHDLEQV